MNTYTTDHCECVEATCTPRRLGKLREKNRKNMRVSGGASAGPGSVPEEGEEDPDHIVVVSF